MLLILMRVNRRRQGLSGKPGCVVTHVILSLAPGRRVPALIVSAVHLGEDEKVPGSGGFRGL